MGKNNNWYVGAVIIAALLIGGFTGATWFSNDEVQYQTDPNTQKALEQALDEIASLKTALSNSAPSVPEVPKVPKDLPNVGEPKEEDSIWANRAWERVLDEFENDDVFWTCGGHEFDEDEVEFDIEDYNVNYHRNGDIIVELERVEFTFDDDSDERSCKEDRVFTYFIDENDIGDEDWDEGIVEWVLPITA